MSLLQAAKNKERVGFNSTEKRFSEKAKNSYPGILIVGPGDYRNESIDYIERKSGKAFISPINYIRLPNAPSIPSHEYVFGYDETEGTITRWRISSTRKSKFNLYWKKG